MVSNYLQGQPSSATPFSAGQTSVLRWLDRFPVAWTRDLGQQFRRKKRVQVHELAQLTEEERLGTVLAAYPEIPEKRNAVVMGGPMGGATAHLAGLLGAPYLPDQFSYWVKGGSQSGNVREYVDRYSDLMQALADLNPHWVSQQRLDPQHDEWLYRCANWMQFKLGGLPAAYSRWIKDVLKPEGGVIYLDCMAKSLRYQLGERNYLQVGRWRETDLQQIAEQAKTPPWERARIDRWDLDLRGADLGEGPDAAWGCEPGLGQALESFCQENGYLFIRICLPEPFDFSRLAWKAAHFRWRQLGVLARGILLEVGRQYDLFWAERAGLVSLWLPENSRESLAYLRQMLPELPVDWPVYQAGPLSFSHDWDIPLYGEWVNIFEGRKWIQLGSRERFYPVDLARLPLWETPLAALPAVIDVGRSSQFTVEDLVAIAHTL